MRTQFIVRVDDKKERTNFFDYIVDTYDFNIGFPYTREAFTEHNFPFVVDFKERKIWICSSITCLACASQAGVIFSVEEFNKMVRKTH